HGALAQVESSVPAQLTGTVVISVFAVVIFVMIEGRFAATPSVAPKFVCKAVVTAAGTGVVRNLPSAVVTHPPAVVFAVLMVWVSAVEQGCPPPLLHLRILSPDFNLGTAFLPVRASIPLPRPQIEATALTADKSASSSSAL